MECSLQWHKIFKESSHYWILCCLFLRRKTDFFTGAGPEQIEALIMKLVKKHSDINTKQINAKKSSSASSNQESAKKKESKPVVKPVPAPAPTASKVAVQEEEEEDDVLELSSDGTFDATQVKAPAPATLPPSSTASSGDKAAETSEEEDKNTSPSRKCPLDEFVYLPTYSNYFNEFVCIFTYSLTSLCDLQRRAMAAGRSATCGRRRWRT